MNFEGLLSFRKWLLDHSCQKLAVESTANYWQPIYLVVGKDVEFVLANAYQIEDILDSIPSKKIKAKREEIRNAIQVHISQVQMDLIGRLLGRLSLMRFRFSSERFM